MKNWHQFYQKIFQIIILIYEKYNNNKIVLLTGDLLCSLKARTQGQTVVYIHKDTYDMYSYGVPAAGVGGGKGDDPEKRVKNDNSFLFLLYSADEKTARTLGRASRLQAFQQQGVANMRLNNLLAPNRYGKLSWSTQRQR